MIASRQDLEVRKVEKEIAGRAIVIVRESPLEERYGLASQVRRAAASVPSNIAEGWGKDNRGNHLPCMRHAIGSLKEVETQTILAPRVG